MKEFYTTSGKKCIIITIFWDNNVAYFVYKSLDEFFKIYDYQIVLVTHVSEGFENGYFFRSKYHYKKYIKTLENEA